ncbi:efflux RND transporter permease subunit [Gallaecimonas mangrovi]|uniref:efflux RND transporter permease subunit n=1 Tax=Gallaecimonas mangrovi TaxID=2291597 RepID=UPI000E1FFA18|nr:efflux RND transporter permease subunit [Gallaecimonas mangrovi]
MSQTSGVIAWFTRNSVAANLLMLLVICLGLAAFGNLRKEAFPPLPPSKVTVSVSYPSGSAKQAEEGIAMKVEDALEGVSGIKRVTSKSTGSGVTVTIEKTSDYDLATLLTDVKTKVDAISNFPADAEKPVIEKAQREDHAIWLTLYGDTDQHTLQSLAERIKRSLLSKAAIHKVTFGGKADPMMIVEIDESKLQAFGISISDVENAVKNESQTPLTGSLRSSNRTLVLKAVDKARTVADFEAIPVVQTDSGTLITLGQIASIREGVEDDPQILSRFNGAPAVGLEVILDGTSDVVDAVNQAKTVAQQWRDNGQLPKNVHIETWYDRSSLIVDRLNLLLQNALTGMALVFVSLALFLNVRVAFWVAAGLPFIFLGTLFLMGADFFNLSLNELTTFGFIMALGIVVDDAVVVGESVYDERSRYGDTLANTIKGTMKVAIPTVFGVATTVAAFVPLSMIAGNLGKIYSQFAIVVAICLILSLIESKLILPAHLAHLDTRKRKPGNPISYGWSRLQYWADRGLYVFTHRYYKKALFWTLRFRYAAVVLFIAIFVGVLSMPFTGAMRMVFFPDIPGDTIRASFSMQNDASFGMTHRNAMLLEKQALQVQKELQKQYHTDKPIIAEISTVASSDTAGEVIVFLNKGAGLPDNKTFENRWRALGGMPEGVKKVSYASRWSGPDAFRLELRDSDQAALESAGARVKAALEKIEGVNDIDDNLTPGEAQLKFTVTPSGRALGFTAGDLADQLLQGFTGSIVQRFQRNNDELKVRIRYPEYARQSLADLQNAKLRTSDGTVVPLSAVASYQQVEVLGTITRIDNMRAAYISSGIDKSITSAGQVIAMLKSQVIPDLKQDYPGLQLHFAGEAEEQAETQGSMQHLFLLTLLAIYALLAIPLRSYVQPLVIMCAIPFGIVGAILGHWVNGLAISMLSINGILALSGVVVNDSLMLVSRFNDNRHYYKGAYKSLVMACTGRLRAIFLTSLTTVAGLLPLLGETSKQAQFLIPAAAALAYGIAFATVITLLLIPSLLLIVEDIKALLAKFKGEVKTALEPAAEGLDKR